MKIKYKDADGKIIELEVSEEVGTFYLESVAAEKSNDRKNSRPDRHTPLGKVDGYLFRDADGHSVLVYNRPDQPKHSFNHESHFEMQLIKKESIAQIVSCLNDRQRYLITKCILEDWSYTDLAKLEDKDESAIRHAVNRAIKKMKKSLE
jgi:RNA polymerase sigma-70 factor (ECF subfamily)